MARKLLFYATVVIATIVFPVLGVIATVGYTVFAIARAIWSRLVQPLQPNPEPRPRNA